jgi:hypothetical protein
VIRSGFVESCLPLLPDESVKQAVQMYESDGGAGRSQSSTVISAAPQARTILRTEINVRVKLGELL